ncbi:hypothetical protein GP486_006201 [Trichoglossum hirsutum]|uniref:Uncharacterized protein n=1 Tax=Trichoglossum hirsutum TaxID=265104 RepID=A0A9P8IJA9_9PEZI|nr:hypothetical protein GP486_006201 [Trichoglossum hirsutum]
MSENSSSPKKRKIGRLLSPEELRPFVDQAYASVLEAATSDPKVEHAFGILREALDEAQNINIRIPASSLDLEKLYYYFGVIDGSESAWELARTDDEKEEYGTTWMADAIYDLRSSAFWHSQSSEALVRTTVDIVIFDRLKLLDSSEAARKLKIVGEYPIETKTKDPKVVISGRVDYAIGYGGASTKSLDSALVAVEAKPSVNFSTAFAQLTAYLIGLQQQRKSKNKNVTVVYGIATNGRLWEFVRIDEEQKIFRSKPLLLSPTGKMDDHIQIYRFIDNILEAAIRSSPHTTPSKAFVTSSQYHSMAVEAPRFTLETGWKEVDLNDPQYEVCDIVTQTDGSIKLVPRPLDSDEKKAYVCTFRNSGE